MKKFVSADDIYLNIKELIINLRSINEDNFAAVLEHRTFKVSWTTQNELFEELIKVIEDFQTSTKVPREIAKQMDDIVYALKANL